MVPVRRNPLGATSLLLASLTLNPPAVAVDALHDAALTWRRIPPSAPSARGARLLVDAAPPAGIVLATVRGIARVNPRLGALDALAFAVAARDAADDAGIDPAFVVATLLQESSFDPRAISAAGAVGIGQFTVGTADAAGIDPWRPAEAIGGTARLLARYVARYAGRYPGADPYALALAAYNAGPEAVARYGGIPPYAETRAYVTDVFWRWGRLVQDARRRARSQRRTVWGY